MSPRSLRRPPSRHAPRNFTPVWVLAVLLAAGGGFWAGGKRLPPEILVVSCPAAECSEKAEIPPPAVSAKGRSAQTLRTEQSRSARALPELSELAEPREELLAYLQSRSSELESCASALQRLRLTLRIEARAGGDVSRVQVLSQSPDSGVETAACITQRLETWTLPAKWIPEDRVLIVSMVL